MMNNIPAEELVASQKSFNIVIGIRPNGDRNTMCQCINCKVVVRNDIVIKWKHW